MSPEKETPQPPGQPVSVLRHPQHKKVLSQFFMLEVLGQSVTFRHGYCKNGVGLFNVASEVRSDFFCSLTSLIELGFVNGCFFLCICLCHAISQCKLEYRELASV